MKIISTTDFGIKRIKVFVYGNSGAGKTFSARTLPHEKGLVISAEAGLLSLSDTAIAAFDITIDDQGKEVPREKRIARLSEIFKYLNTEEAQKKYEWIFIDSLTEISQNLVEQLAIDFPERKDALPMWGEYNKRMTALIKSFRDLPHYHVIMTALASTVQDENARLIQTIDINGKAIKKRIPQFFDEVFYCELLEGPDGKKKGTFRTHNTEKTIGKDRSGKLASVEPSDFSIVFSKIQNVNNLGKGK